MLDYNTEFTVNTVDMTLSETCNYLQISTINAINEFQTTVLLNEYGYLLENGCEIDYDVDNSDIITEGVMDLFTKIKEWIKATYEKLVNWISDRIDDVRQWFSKVGLRREKVQNAILMYNELLRKEIGKDSLPTYNGIWVDMDKLKKVLPNIMSKINRNNFIFDIFKWRQSIDSIAQKEISQFMRGREGKFFTNPIEPSVKKYQGIISLDIANEALDIVYNTGNVVKSIRISQAQAIKQIEDMIRSNSTKSKSADLKEIDRLKNGIKVVSEVSKELIRLYRDGIESAIRILKSVVSCVNSKQVRAMIQDNISYRRNKELANINNTRRNYNYNQNDNTNTSSNLNYNISDITSHNYNQSDITSHNYNQSDITSHNYNQSDITSHNYNKNDNTNLNYNKSDITNHNHNYNHKILDNDPKKKKGKFFLW